MLRVMLREMLPHLLRQALRLMLRWLLRSMPTNVLREMPTLLLTVLPRRCQPGCPAAANRTANRKKLASMVALLACRVRCPNLCGSVLASGRRWPAY